MTILRLSDLTDAKPFPADRVTIRHDASGIDPTWEVHTHYAVSGLYSVTRRADGEILVLSWHGRNSWVDAGPKVAARVLATLARDFPADFAPVVEAAPVETVEAGEGPRGTTDMRDDAQHRTTAALVSDLRGFRGMLDVYAKHGASDADWLAMIRHVAVWRAELIGRAAIQLDPEPAATPVTSVAGLATMRAAHKRYAAARRTWNDAADVLRGGLSDRTYTEESRRVLRQLSRRAAVLRARFNVTVRAMARHYGAEV